MVCNFYTLLYIDPEERRRMAGRTLTGGKRIDVFVKSACLLNKSLRWAFNVQDNKEVSYNPYLTILTNDCSVIRESLLRVGGDVKVKEIDFTLNVPKGIPYYSAHYKIEAFRYFSTLPDSQYSILLDCDLVALKGANDNLKGIVQSAKPMCYILPNYTSDKFLHDCRRVYPKMVACEWTGGEIWGGYK